MKVQQKLPISLQPILREFFSSSSKSNENLTDFLGCNSAFPPDRREVLVKVLKEQYNDLNMGIKVNENIAALLQPNASTVVTGHQLCLAGGPLFLLYKISSTVALANELNNAQNEERFIPVFWMASEDHDLKEISEFYFKGEKIHLGIDEEGIAGEFPTLHFKLWLENLSGQSNELIELLKQAYSKYNRNVDAMRYWIHAIFGEDGVVCLDANHSELKEVARPLFERELDELFIHEAVRKQNLVLKNKGYEPAIEPRKCNLFLIQNGKRERLESSENEFSTVHSKQLFLREELKSNLQALSPNVLCRPLYQQYILPNVAYIGGPGELAYWMQLNQAFSHMEMNFPKLIHRNSATLIKQRDWEFMEKHQLEWKEIQLRIQNAKETLLSKLGKFDTTRFQVKVESDMEEVVEKAKVIDPTLEPWLRAEMKRQIQQWQQIEGKVIRPYKGKKMRCFPDSAKFINL
jgi:bacillithiol biosynthesis cysteine-adding enzyme BshC